MPEVEAFHSELGRDGAGRDAMAFDLVERGEEVGDVPIRLLDAPTFAGVALDLVKPQRRGLLDADGHVAIPGSGRSPRRRSADDNFSPELRRRVSVRPSAG